MKTIPRAVSLACLLAVGTAGGLRAVQAADPTVAPPASARPAADAQAAARIEAAARVVQRMTVNPEVRALLQDATGLFIVPDFGRRAMRVKPRAHGVLVVRRDSGWSDPLFYDTGPIVLGAHAGASIDSLAAILLSEQAVGRFASGKTFSLSLDGGFNMANHESQGGPFPDEGDDVVMWSNAAGLFPGAAVRLDRVRPDTVGNTDLHGHEVELERIVRRQARLPEARALREALGV